MSPLQKLNFSRGRPVFGTFLSADGGLGALDLRRSFAIARLRFGAGEVLASFATRVKRAELGPTRCAVARARPCVTRGRRWFVGFGVSCSDRVFKVFLLIC